MVWWNAVSNTATCANPGRTALTASIPAQVRRVVQRRQRDERADRGDNLVVHQDRCAEPLSPVDHRMTGAHQASLIVPGFGQVVEDPGDDGVIAASGEAFGLVLREPGQPEGGLVQGGGGLVGDRPTGGYGGGEDDAPVVGGHLPLDEAALFESAGGVGDDVGWWRW